MSQVAKHEDMDAANNTRFERVAETTSKALLQHTADLGMAVKLFHLETESLREVKESLHAEMVQFLKAELNASATSFGNQLFTAFSGKAITFLDSRFASVSRANDDLKKTMHTWSNLSFKCLSLLTLSSVLIGISAFFVSHYLIPSQKFTQTEIKCIHYGKAYILNSEKFPLEITRVVAEAADKLIKNNLEKYKQ